MADVTKVKASDGTIYDVKDVSSYTKEETDALLAEKTDDLGYVEVLGNGVKTLSALLLELYAAHDSSKSSVRAVLVIQYASAITVYQKVSDNMFNYCSQADIGSATTPASHFINFETGNCRYYRTNGNTTDEGSAIIPDGNYVRLYY